MLQSNQRSQRFNTQDNDGLKRKNTTCRIRQNNTVVLADMHVIKAILGDDVRQVRKWGHYRFKDRKKMNDSMLNNLRVWLPLQL